MNHEKLKQYAKLAVDVGLEIKEGDVVLINSPIAAAEFTREVVRAAYEAGAKDVEINWQDDAITRMRYENEPLSQFENFPEWRKMKMNDYGDRGCKALSISASDPDLLAGIDSDKIIAAQRAGSEALKNYRDKMMRDENSWCVLSVPTPAWAKKIFPEKSEEEAVASLWELIFKATRMDEQDPVAAWNDHLNTLGEKTKALQELDLAEVHYETAKGTDLTVKLPEGHLWVSGLSKNKKGEIFVPNLPTEEVFSMPDKYGVNGVLHSTKPLVYGGQLIDDFTLEFKEGRVQNYSAKTGEKALSELFSVDEGARYLGEIALVPHRSPISDTGVTFFNTLFDENASCHFAFGEAYPTNVEGGEHLSKEELEERHVNTSLVHEDFMVGDETLNITGTTKSGEKVAIFKNGAWAI